MYASRRAPESSTDSQVGAEHRARLRAEAEAVARLSNRHIVQIYEVGEHAGVPYLAMELVDGIGLDRVIAGTPQPAQAAAGLLAVLARAMEHAHQRGIVHRDLKSAEMVFAVAFSPDGRRLTSAGQDNSVRIWDVAGERPWWRSRAGAGQVHCLA